MAEGPIRSVKVDWMAIILAHVAWKPRLTALLAGESTEISDPDVVRADNCCPPGQWFCGEGGGTAMSRLPRYEKVRILCAQFRANAAEIVKPYTGNRPDEVSELLGGEFSRLPKKPGHRIIGQPQQVKASTDGIPRF